MQSLEEQMLERFSRRLEQHLVKSFPFRFGEGRIEQAFDFALACTRHARSLGISTEAGITRYANLSTLLGPGFETAAYAQELGLAPGPGECLDPAWLNRVVPAVAIMLRKRGN